MIMKKLFVANTKYLNSDIALLTGRALIAALMLSHGLPKMQMLFSDGALQFPAALGMSAGLSLALAVFAEVVCSLLILVGLGTRLASIPLIITMLVAAFSIHAAEGFAKMELPLLYLAGYFVFFIAGSGKYSVDQLIKQKR